MIGQAVLACAQLAKPVCMSSRVEIEKLSAGLVKMDKNKMRAMVPLRSEMNLRIGRGSVVGGGTNHTSLDQLASNHHVPEAFNYSETWAYPSSFLIGLG